MRSIVIFLLLVFLTNACVIGVSRANLATTNSTESSIRPYIYVSGGVIKPGRYDWFPGMTVVDAINAAGGFTDSAGHHILILHSDGSRESFNWDTFAFGADKPPVLRADDNISVPKRIF